MKRIQILVYKILNFLSKVLLESKIVYLESYYGQHINFVKQGEFEVNIVGPKNNFKIDRTSHLKSGAFIDCSGGVYIGKYFHTGKNLTIYSSNHNYNSTKIPYDEDSILKEVIIENYVWCGANVTILPGVTLSEGMVVGAGSVVTKKWPKGSVIAGNPAKPIGMRNIDLFEQNKQNEKFF